MSLKLIETHDKQDDNYVLEQLRRHNASVVERDIAPVSLYFKDEDGNIFAGLTGRTQWGALHIEILWVSEESRGESLGAKLVKRAIDIAKERKCQNVILETMGFQAKGFYLKQGFEVFGVVENENPELSCFYLKKVL